MVDVGQKEVTVREATASGRVETTAEVVDALRAGTMPKGDVIAAARPAGIMAVKRTPDLIPLCHPIGISGADVDLDLSAAKPCGDSGERPHCGSNGRRDGGTGRRWPRLDSP